MRYHPTHADVTRQKQVPWIQVDWLYLASLPEEQSAIVYYRVNYFTTWKLHANEMGKLVHLTSLSWLTEGEAEMPGGIAITRHQLFQ